MSELITSLLTPEQQLAIEYSAFLRRLGEEYKQDGARYFGEGKVGASQACHDRMERLGRIADLIEAGAGLPAQTAPDGLWAVRGHCADTHSDDEIRTNSQHYEIWTWGQCHQEDGSPKFNLSFLGKWRTGPVPTQPRC